MEIKRKKKEKRIQIVGALLGICVAATALFYFFHVEKAEAERRMVEIVNTSKCSAQPTPTIMNLRNPKVFSVRLKVPDR